MWSQCCLAVDVTDAVWEYLGPVSILSPKYLESDFKLAASNTIESATNTFIAKCLPILFSTGRAYADEGTVRHHTL